MSKLLLKYDLHVLKDALFLQQFCTCDLLVAHKDNMMIITKKKIVIITEVQLQDIIYNCKY
jgi:hypothetical protein